MKFKAECFEASGRLCGPKDKERVFNARFRLIGEVDAKGAPVEVKAGLPAFEGELNIRHHGGKRFTEGDQVVVEIAEE